MHQFQVTSMSSKGQVVIPTDIRKIMGIDNGSKLIVFTDGDNLLLKPIQIPRVETFKALIKESQKLVKKRKLKKNDVQRIIKEVRNENRS